MTAALEARARWHLEIGYPPISEEALDELVDDDGYESDYLGHVACWNCGGEGFVVVCFDDLCRGAGVCMHGDGHEMCRECKGEVFL